MEDGWTLDPRSFVEGTWLEEHYDPEDAGFFHVTTAASAIDRQRVLLSRGDLQRAGLQRQGLGGGKPDAISFGLSLAQAKKLFGAMRTVRRAMLGQIPLTDYLVEILGWTGFPDDWDFGDDWMDEEEDGGRMLAATDDLLSALGFSPEQVRRRHRLALDSLGGWRSFFEQHGGALGERLSRPY